MSEPLTPIDLDLRDFPYMPLEVVRLRDSDLTVVASGDEFRAAVLLWCASWHQVPASSLPNDERLLANLAGYGRDLKGWRSVSSAALRGFILCSDDRLYHPVIADKAIEAESKRRKQKAKTNAANAAHWGKREEVAGDHKQRRSQRLAEARRRGRHTESEWRALVEFCSFSCVKCGEQTEICKDHIIPIYRNGSDAIDNLQPMCGPCNSRKGDDTSDYRPEGWQHVISDASSHGVLNASAQGIKKPSERLQEKGREEKGKKEERPIQGKILSVEGGEL